MIITNNNPKSSWLRRWSVSAAMIAVIAMAAVAVKHCCFDNRPIDVLMASISSLGGHFTVYAGSYRESGFRSIRIGMTAHEVEQIMGPPLNRGNWGVSLDGDDVNEYWSYTRPGKNNGCYWNRAIYFMDGVVREVDRTFYVD